MVIRTTSKVKCILETYSKDGSFEPFYEIVESNTIMGCYEGEDYIECPHEYTEANLEKFGLFEELIKLKETLYN